MTEMPATEIAEREYLIKKKRAEAGVENGHIKVVRFGADFPSDLSGNGKITLERRLTAILNEQGLEAVVDIYNHDTAKDTCCLVISKILRE
ncbi:MAG: hypothetical protein AABY01_02195 [Nanoarchaeota archaeon]